MSLELEPDQLKTVTLSETGLLSICLLTDIYIYILCTAVLLLFFLVVVEPRLGGWSYSGTQAVLDFA